MNTINKLENNDDFTSSEKSLASYILANKESALKMNLQDLADCAFVSKPTVIRLYRKLGFESYNEFRISFYQQLAKDNNLIPVDYNNPFFLHDSTEKIVNNISNLYQGTIKETCDINSSDLFAKVADLINESDRIFIFAIGDSFIQAKSFLNKLIKINKYPILINENSDTLPNIFNITESDCFLAVSYSGSMLINSLSTLDYLETINCRKILITSSEDDRIILKFNHIIRLPKGEKQYQKIGTIVSQTAINFVFSILYCMLYEIEYDAYLKQNKAYKQFADKINEEEYKNY